MGAERSSPPASATASGSTGDLVEAIDGDRHRIEAVPTDSPPAVGDEDRKPQDDEDRIPQDDEDRIGWRRQDLVVPPEAAEPPNASVAKNEGYPEGLVGALPEEDKPHTTSSSAPQEADDEGADVQVFSHDDYCKLNGQIMSALASAARKWACEGRGRPYRQAVRRLRKVKKQYDRNHCS